MRTLRLIIWLNERSQMKDAIRYDWSQELQGIILSSFYWGYIFTQIPGGILAQRFGGKHVLTIGLLFAAICTLLTPLCVQYGKIALLNFMSKFRIFVKHNCFYLLAFFSRCGGPNNAQSVDGHW